MQAARDRIKELAKDHFAAYTKSVCAMLNNMPVNDGVVHRYRDDSIALSDLKQAIEDETATAPALVGSSSNAGKLLLTALVAETKARGLPGILPMTAVQLQLTELSEQYDHETAGVTLAEAAMALVAKAARPALAKHEALLQEKYAKVAVERMIGGHAGNGELAAPARKRSKVAGVGPLARSNPVDPEIRAQGRLLQDLLGGKQVCWDYLKNKTKCGEGCGRLPCSLGDGDPQMRQFLEAQKQVKRGG